MTNRQKPPLSERAMIDLYTSGISQEFATQNGVYTEYNRGEIQRLLDRKPGFLGRATVFKYRNAANDEYDGYVRVKPESPRRRDGKPVKYETPSGQPPRLYIPEISWGKFFVERGRQPGVTLITDGEKKALSADARGYCCVAVSGMSSWHRPGSDELLSDFDYISLRGRRVYMCFDSDVGQRIDLQLQEWKFCRALQNAGADVAIVRFPWDVVPAVRFLCADGGKAGLDDFLVHEGKEAFDKLLAEATDPVSPL